MPTPQGQRWVKRVKRVRRVKKVRGVRFTKDAEPRAYRTSVSRFRIVPVCPTVHTLFASLQKTPYRGFNVPVASADHAVPFHRMIVPASPTAHRLFASTPHMPIRTLVVPEVCAAHVVPFHFRILSRTL